MGDLSKWLDTLGLGKYTGLFVENAIDEEILSDLTDADLKQLGIALGHRKKLLKAIALLHSKCLPTPLGAGDSDTPSLDHVSVSTEAE